MSRVVVVNNAPAPYRIPVYDELGRLLGGDLHVIYCTGREPGRRWDLPAIGHDHTILEAESRGLRHDHPAILRLLRGIGPGVVITGGFAPTFLYAWGWSALARRAHIPFTDGTPESEAALGPLHRIARRAVYRTSAAFLGASERSLALYRGYRVRDDRLFKSVLAVDAPRFAAAGARTPSEFDLVFSGRLVRAKMPEFFLEVCAQVARRRGRCSALVLGDGPLRPLLEARALARRLDVTFAGFRSQAELPASYASGRLLLFPTAGDTWGVVANEALAAGLPAITCPAAGVAGELVIHGVNGYVLPLDPDEWAARAATLLDDEALRARMGRAGAELSARYDFESAARGILDAVRSVS